MIKIGDNVYHYQTMNRIGVVTNIITKKNNQLTVGGTTDARVFVEVKYAEQDVLIYKIGDLQKSFD